MKHTLYGYVDPPSPQERRDAAARLRERDAREAQDTRTELERIMGHPMPSLSALAKLQPPKPKRAVTEDDVHAAMAFARIVSDRLARIAAVGRTRVRLKSRD